MSRNVRRKAPATSKRSKRRDSDTTSASSFDLSDDDGYSAVEDITDSEDDDEEDVAAVEEENIRTETIQEPLTSPRPPSEDLDDDDEQEDDQEIPSDQEFEIEVDISVDGNPDLEDGDAEAEADEQTSWAGIVSEGEDNQVSDFYNDASAFTSDTAIERHVRFDVPSSDSDSTDTEDDDHGDLFPDIFVSQNSLDPAFRKEIENDVDDDSSGSGTFWDYSGGHHGHYDNDDSDAEEIIRQLSDDETPTATPISKTIKSEMDMTPTFNGVQDLDGYESESCLLRDFCLLAYANLSPQPTVILPRKTNQSPPYGESRGVPLWPLVK